MTAEPFSSVRWAWLTLTVTFEMVSRDKNGDQGICRTYHVLGLLANNDRTVSIKTCVLMFHRPIFSGHFTYSSYTFASQFCPILQCPALMTLLSEMYI